MSALLPRTMFLCQMVAVVLVVLISTSLVHGEHEAASKVNYCLTSALQISSVQDLKNVVFEECIHQQIQNENVSVLTDKISFLSYISFKYSSRVRFSHGLYYFYIFPTVWIYLKFCGITLVLCGLYLREVYGREMVNFTRVW